MEAFKFQVTIPEQRKIVLEVPAEAPTGEAEVIVLFSRKTQAKNPVQPDSLLRFLDELGEHDAPRTQAEIDRQLQVERDDWD